MDLLTPNWEQAEPSPDEVARMLGTLPVRRIVIPAIAESFVSDLSSAFDNGGAHLLGFEIPRNPIFDWYVSRNRWAFDGLAALLLRQPAISDALKVIEVSDNPTAGLQQESSFLLPGRLANLLHAGGAYYQRERKRQSGVRAGGRHL